jgi:hypothetical protein
VNVQHIGPRTLGVSLGDAAASFASVAAAFGIPPTDWSAPKAFTFHRQRREGRWGWGVGLKVGRLWVNLGPDMIRDSHPYLATLADARTWAIGFAERNGFEPMQVPRTRRPARPVLRVIPGGAP